MLYISPRERIAQTGGGEFLPRCYPCRRPGETPGTCTITKDLAADWVGLGWARNGRESPLDERPLVVQMFDAISRRLSIEIALTYVYIYRR